MTTIPIYYRQEILKPFFDYVKSGESFYVIGAPSSGKTRLMDFMMGDDPDASRVGLDVEHDRVKNEYLGEAAASRVWLARVDMNRLRPEYDWGFGFYELLLNTLLLTCNRQKQTEDVEKLQQELAGLDSQVMESKDALTAHRLFEMAVNRICHVYNIQVCFLFDEFDDTYQSMPRDVFAQLRAIRDANKYSLSYVLFLRNLPKKLRNPLENEGFYELISRSIVGLGPFSTRDTFHVIGQLEARHNYDLSLEKRDWLCAQSGGHPGLIQALFVILKEHSHATSQMENLKWFAQQESVSEEFRKLWAGLLEEEQTGLMQIARGEQASVAPETGKMLLAKGLIKSTGGRMVCFTPLFEYWLMR